MFLCIMLPAAAAVRGASTSFVRLRKRRDKRRNSMQKNIRWIIFYPPLTVHPCRSLAMKYQFEYKSEACQLRLFDMAGNLSSSSRFFLSNLNSFLSRAGTFLVAFHAAAALGWQNRITEHNRKTSCVSRDIIQFQPTQQVEHWSLSSIIVSLVCARQPRTRRRRRHWMKSDSNSQCAENCLVATLYQYLDLAVFVVPVSDIIQSTLSRSYSTHWTLLTWQFF